jgi:hypothetical protein
VNFMTQPSSSSEMEGNAGCFPFREYVHEDDEDPTRMGLARSVEGKDAGESFFTGAGASRLGTVSTVMT